MKEKTLRYLIENSDKFVSGQELSEWLGISRTAVWKHVKSLQKKGYDISAVPNRGYKLVASPDVLSAEELYPMLDTSIIGRKIIYMDEVSSTNDYAKQIALLESEGAVVIAEEQLKGRGRMGRHWVSPQHTGIWMSVILKPNIRPDRAYQITQAIAVAVAKAVEQVTGLGTGIKWPNDIIVNGKKVCGILTEMSAEPDCINYIIVGIGINVNMGSKDIPLFLKDKATSLKEVLGEKVSRKVLTAAVLRNIEKVYFDFTEKGFKEIVSDCRRYSVLLGKQVTVVQVDTSYNGIATGINDDGTLMIRTVDGVIHAVSGDVTIRGSDGYV